MAALVHVESPVVRPFERSGAIRVQELANGERPALLVVFGEGEEGIISIIADVLGQPWSLATSVQEVVTKIDEAVIGIRKAYAASGLERRDSSRLVLHMHCADGGQVADEILSRSCDYEYLYTHSPFLRRDLARYLSFILGQINPHQDLAKRTRTTLISTTFPDVHAALPNLDILSVGADAIELRVDLLREPLPDGTYNAVPSLKYVGKQLMTLRQRTELSIIYTTRCINENGRFPMDDPTLFHSYLYRAIQWGCECIDVELWLPEGIRKRLAESKGNSKIISAFHDFSGNFR